MKKKNETICVGYFTVYNECDILQYVEMIISIVISRLFNSILVKVINLAV